MRELNTGDGLRDRQVDESHRRVDKREMVEHSELERRKKNKVICSCVDNFEKINKVICSQ